MPTQDDDLDPDVLNAIQNQYSGGSSGLDPSAIGSFLKTQGGALWDALSGNKPGLSQGQVPFSSKFGSADEWQAYNNAISDKMPPSGQGGMGSLSGVDAAQVSSSPDDSPPLPGAQAGLLASQSVGPTGVSPSSTPSLGGLGKPLMTLASNSPVSGAGPDPAVSQAIAQKYGFGAGLDSDAIKAAQERARQDTLNANLGEAGNDIANAFVMGRGGKPFLDNKFYENLKTQAQQPIQNISALRQAKLQDLGAANTMAENDPNSEVSKNARLVYSKLGIPQEALEGMSAADLKGLQNPVEVMAKLQTSKDSKQAQLAVAQANKELAMGEKEKSHLQAAQGKVMGDAVLNELQKNLDASDSLDKQADLAKTNPRAAAQLPMAVVRTMVSRMNPQELQQAGGGQDISDVANRMSQKMTKGTLDQEDYKQLKEWISTMKSSQQSAYDSRSKLHINGYSQISGKSPDESRAALGLLPAGGAPIDANAHPQDSEALEWAKSNPNDPRAAKIMSLQGS